MLKKAGIVVAAAAAGLLALSPLAFAGDKGTEHDGGKGDHHTTVVESADAPQCTFDAAGANSAEQLGEGGDSLLGLGGLVANTTGAQANTQGQAPVGSCNNLEDLVDVNVEDNFQDNSTTTSDTTTEIENSGNTEG